MNTFSEILAEKLKKQKISIDEMSDKNLSQSLTSMNPSNRLDFDSFISNTISIKTRKPYFRVEDSSYSIYKKDPKTLQMEKIKREEKAFSGFLAKMQTEDQKESARFFYNLGMRDFMSFTLKSLRKDYKRLVLKLHPDRHFNEIASVQKQFQEDFKQLQDSYESLKTCVSGP